MIHIERYTSPHVDVYHKKEGFLGTFLNEHEFNRFRINVLKQKATGDYYFMWGDVKITLDKDGNMDKFPFGLYDQLNRDLGELFAVRSDNYTKEKIKIAQRLSKF